MIDIARLKEQLAKTKLTANAASEAAGLGRSYVRDILRGRIKDPSSWRLSQLADVLQTTPNYLLGLEDSTWDAQRQVDDRTRGRAEYSAEQIRLAAKNGTPSTKLMFDLLDSINDKMLVEMVYEWVRSSLYIHISGASDLSQSELRVLCGDEDDDSQSAYLRRVIIARMLGLIDKRASVEGTVLSQVRAYMSVAGGSPSLNDERVIEILAPMVRSHGGLGYDSETARLTVMATFARFLNLGDGPGQRSPGTARDDASPSKSPTRGTNIAD